MKLPVFFFSSNCQDTPAFKAKLSELNIQSESVDIIESMKNLKRFLKIRDTDIAFNNIKADELAGVPVLMTNDGKYLFTPEALVAHYRDN